MRKSEPKSSEQKAIDAVHKAIKNTWMRSYELDPNLEELSNEELARRYARFPKTLNDVSEEDQKELAQLWMEKRRRYELGKQKVKSEWSNEYKKLEDSGMWPNGAPFPKDGDVVYRYIPSILGVPTRIEGVVKKKTDGSYIVKITSQNAGGAKTTDLTASWKLKESVHESFRQRIENVLNEASSMETE